MTPEFVNYSVMSDFTLIMCSNGFTQRYISRMLIIYFHNNSLMKLYLPTKQAKTHHTLEQYTYCIFDLHVAYKYFVPISNILTV